MSAAVSTSDAVGIVATLALQVAIFCLEWRHGRVAPAAAVTLRESA
jgi:hypothetical protein